MRKWTGRIAGAVGMGVAWAGAWGIIVVLVSLIIDPVGAMDEMWVAVGAYPGFLAGLIFYGLLAAFGHGRGGTWSLPRGGVAGAATGLVPGLFPLVLVAALAARTDYAAWPLAALTYAGTTVASAVLAIGSVLWIRHRARGAAGRSV